MKILLLSDDFPPKSFGGAGRVVFNLALKLQNLGHVIYVITTVQEKSKLNKEKYHGLEIFKIYSRYHPRWRAYLSLYNPQTIGQIKKIIRNIKPDIIHAHNIHQYLSYHSLKVANRYSKAVFLTAHDFMLFHYGKLTECINQYDLSLPKKLNYKITPWQQIRRFKKWYNPFRNIIIKYYLRYVDKIFVISYNLEEILNQNGIKNTEVIYNGIDINEWQEDSNKVRRFKQKFGLLDKKVILFGGRLSASKGGEKIIQAMEKIIQKAPDAVLLIVGKQNAYAQNMLKLPQKLNLKKNIILTGWLEKEDIKNAFFSSTLCVTPSIYPDPFNLINIEAMACRKPVIGTCFGATPEIVVNNETGCIVNPLNTKLLAERIIDLLNNPQKVKRFGEQGNQRVKEKFSLDTQAQNVLKWYNKFI